MTRQTTINKVIDFLTRVKNAGYTSVLQYCRDFNEPYQNYIVNINRILKDEELNDECKNTIRTLKSDIKCNNKTTNSVVNSEKIDSDDRASTEIVRDEEGKVLYYKFEIYRRDKSPVVGQLTREEMNSVYRLYSYYGANITQREISRTLPEYSLVDFKRILRVFNITKACSPFAPHMYEEYTENELKDMHLRLKENDFLKKLEKEEVEDLKKLNIKLAKELNNLKNNVIQNVIDAGLEIKDSDYLAFRYAYRSL